MGADKEGNVPVTAFVSYFDEKLSTDKTSFNKEVALTLTPTLLCKVAQSMDAALTLTLLT